MTSNPETYRERRPGDDLSTFNVGRYTVRRERLLGTPRTLYSISLGDDVVGRQISWPNYGDCESHRRQHETVQRAKKRRRMQRTVDGRTLEERATLVLKGQKLRLGELVAELGASAHTVSCLLWRLSREKAVVREGRPGAYTYGAAPDKQPAISE